MDIQYRDDNIEFFHYEEQNETDTIAFYKVHPLDNQQTPQQFFSSSSSTLFP